MLLIYVGVFKSTKVSYSQRLLLLISGIIGVLIIQVLSIAMLMHIKGRKDISNTLIAC